mmetsp:Transcript_26204/g.53685  ORF Transcript_26204/g.53685 Transcript_26204/m.53685 type:complete len:381 (-) Transcript_26204:125-1267(-)|eukprot:CAMPEP_0183307992 /NCGR_PEP_ID=MMETSP0160_2-20130417/19680_1 /TAXON_ID=2839 ORGANISM="Odontella Sinensis, Strain Grunow 1884" /NCGR_SAMPLE_ID=MMETSP0160_2 /ASSEMBLY_ACC=CAM_ASM_000250 /LENGTH=380 /DNA_ID=CAMNT_0025471727 /DNA_START=47 /DNA_END=1189 /DNA_ORIENTATION=+
MTEGNEFHHVEKAITKDQLTLFLYAPMPGYALVCFQKNDTDEDMPTPFKELAADLGDKRQSGMDIKFIVNSDAASHKSYAVDKFPTYGMFKCGSDFVELGRLTSDKTDNEEARKELRNFVLKAQEEASGKTLKETTEEEAAKEKINGLLCCLGEKYKKKLELDKKGCAYLNVGEEQTEIVIKSISSGKSVKLLSYIGKEKHENNVDVMLEALSWNFNADFLHGALVGVDRKTTRFTLDLQKRTVNLDEASFIVFVQKYAKTLDTCTKRLQEERERTKKLSPKSKNAIPSEIGQIREDKLGTKEKPKTKEEQEIPRDSESRKGISKKESRKSTPKSEKELIKQLIEKDKQERRENNGKVRPKLGVGEYRPHGTLYSESDGN